MSDDPRYHTKVRLLLEPDVQIALAQIATDLGCRQEQLSTGLQRVLEGLAYAGWQRCEANRKYISGVWELPEDAITPLVEDEELDRLRRSLVRKRRM